MHILILRLSYYIIYYRHLPTEKDIRRSEFLSFFFPAHDENIELYFYKKIIYD